jgi:hypothetical protein
MHGDPLRSLERTEHEKVLLDTCNFDILGRDRLTERLDNVIELSGDLHICSGTIEIVIVHQVQVFREQ